MAGEVPEADWYADRHQHRLLRDLMFRYDRRVRPQQRPDLPTTITLVMSLYQLLDIVRIRFSGIMLQSVVSIFA